MSGVKPKDIHLHAAQPKTKFAFDEAKPIKSGFLDKQREKLKTMKKRFFVLYPNFLVYYADIEKWQYDLTVGGLARRKGFVKLTGGKASIYTEETKDCRYPFLLHAPDVHNKKQAYLLDTTSAEERKSWIEAISKAVQPVEAKKK